MRETHRARAQDVRRDDVWMREHAERKSRNGNAEWHGTHGPLARPNPGDVPSMRPRSGAGLVRRGRLSPEPEQREDLARPVRTRSKRPNAHLTPERGDSGLELPARLAPGQVAARHAARNQRLLAVDERRDRFASYVAAYDGARGSHGLRAIGRAIGPALEPVEPRHVALPVFGGSCRRQPKARRLSA